MIEEILTIKEVADYLKVAEKTIYRLAGSKRLPGFKVGGIWRFKRNDINKWIEVNKKYVGQNKDEDWCLCRSLMVIRWGLIDWKNNVWTNF